jgi:hypothetical protein
MNISILGFKVNVEILILIGVVFLILVGHTVGGCCNCGMYRAMEGFETSDNKDEQEEGEGEKVENVEKAVAVAEAENDLMPQKGNGDVKPAGNMIVKNAKDGASKASNKAGGKEGFVGANTNYGESSAFDIASAQPVNTASWVQPNLTVVPGQPVNADVKKFLERKQQPLPLPEGELSFLANTEFKPECCPNTYSNSMGCACMTAKDYNYLIMRGGNNVPYSAY